MFKKVFIISFCFSLFCSISAEVDYKFYGNFTAGYWGGKEYDFTRDSLKTNIQINNNDTTIDTVWGKDSSPLSVSEILPAGMFGIKISSEKFNFCIELSAKRSLGNMRYAYGHTGSYFFVYRYSMLAMIGKFYGEWLINDYFSILLGHYPVPCNFSNSSQAYYCGNGFTNTGVLEAGAKPQIRLTAKRPVGSTINLKGAIAAIQPDTMFITLPLLKYQDVPGTDSALILGNIEILDKTYGDYYGSVKIPKFEGKFGLQWDYKTISSNLEFAGGYQQYNIIYKPKPEQPDSIYKVDWKIQSFVLGVSCDFKIGPVSIGYTCSGGENLGAYGVNLGNPFVWKGTVGALANIFYPEGRKDLKKLLPNDGNVVSKDTLRKLDADRLVNNCSALEMAWIGKIKPWEFLGAEGGFGLVKAWSQLKDQKGTWGSKWHDIYAWYFQIEWNINKKFSLVPEIGQYLYGPFRHQGTATYWGFNGSMVF